jgi:Protein of unknown function (DUF3617)
VGRISIASSVFVIFAIASASAAEFPVRKAGLWEITVAGPHSIKVRQCSDAASDQAMALAGIGLPADCPKPDVQESGAAITIDSVCKTAGKTTTAHIVITGSLESKYTMTMTSQAPGKSVAASMTLSAEWLGPCRADQRPGDVILPDGTKVNLLQASGRQ